MVDVPYLGKVYPRKALDHKRRPTFWVVTGVAGTSKGTPGTTAVMVGVTRHGDVVDCRKTMHKDLKRRTPVGEAREDQTTLSLLYSVKLFN